MGRGYVRRVYFGFSIPTLGRTLFAPWRKDTESADGLPFAAKFQVFIDNMISRLFGSVVRLMTLGTGLLVWLFSVTAAATVFLTWLLLPFISILLIGGGLRLLLGGVSG